jgi:hypothetical protein
MRYTYRTAIVLLLLINLGNAQDASSSDREMIRQLVQQVKELQEKVKVLESQHSDTLASDPDSILSRVSKNAPETMGNTMEPPSVAQELHEVHGIRWRGFGNVDYKVLDQRRPELATYGFTPGSSGNFYTGNFDLFLTSKINDKASVLSEIVFEEEQGQKFEVDLERILFKYDFNDHLRMSFGRYHTGIGYYNTTFHTGSWLQSTADRPLTMEFAGEGGLLPTQAVGASVTGLIPSGKVGLNYVAEYGSSDTQRKKLTDQTIVDENNGNHFNVGLFARPAVIPGLQVGGSFYHDMISDLARGPSVRLGQTIVNTHLVYVAHGVEFLSEGFLIRHAYVASLTTFNMPAFYSQLSKRFGHLRPFFRYQYINANQNSILSDVLLREGPSFGTRYDLNDNIAFKTQFDHTLRKGQPDLNGLHLQLAFAF